jgi:CHAT domain-containing protein
LQGFVAARQGSADQARAAYRAALTSSLALRDPVAAADALGMLGDLEGSAGNWLAAEDWYGRAIGKLGNLPAPVLAGRLHTGLGAALRGRGAVEPAARELRLGISETEQVAGRLSLDERRASFLADKWDAYTELALLERARGRPVEAFAASERLRSRQMLDLLARGRIAAPPGVPDSLVVREQDLRRRITDLTRILAPIDRGFASLRGPPAGSTASAQVRETLAGAQREYAELLAALHENDPRYGPMVTPEAVTWSAVASRLEPDQVLLEYLVTDSTTLVFVVSRDSLAALDLGISRKSLASLVDFTRSTLANRPSVRGSSPSLWRAPLQRLHAWLLAPVERAGLLRGKHSLVIVPHAEIHYLPFAALLDEGGRGFVGASYTGTYAPSAALWVRLGDRRSPKRPEAILALAPEPETLPATRGEVNAIRQVFGPRATVLLGSAASESAFRAALGGKTILHLASYGILNKHNPLFSFVELAPTATDDGRLEVHEVFGLGLQSRLVVLSACQTGLGAGAIADVPAGDDWVGLVRAFLVAGASEVLATLWPVDDRATARLMSDFYREIAGGASDATALATAQRAAIRDPSRADPFYWAGFTLVGTQQK